MDLGFGRWMCERRISYANHHAFNKYCFTDGSIRNHCVLTRQYTSYVWWFFWPVSESTNLISSLPTYISYFWLLLQIPMVCLYNGTCILVCIWYVPCIDVAQDLQHLVCIDIIKEWLCQWIHCLEVGKLNQSLFFSYSLWWRTWWNPLEVHDMSHCFENMEMNLGVWNFLEKMFEPWSTNMLKTKEGDGLKKTSLEHENNKK